MSDEENESRVSRITPRRVHVNAARRKGSAGSGVSTGREADALRVAQSAARQLRELEIAGSSPASETDGMSSWACGVAATLSTWRSRVYHPAEDTVTVQPNGMGGWSAKS